MHIQRSWLSTMMCYDLPSCCMLLSFSPASGHQGLDRWSCCHQWSITGAGWCHTWSSSITCCDGPSRVRRATGSVSESIARCDPIKETTLRKGDQSEIVRNSWDMTSRWHHDDPILEPWPFVSTWRTVSTSSNSPSAIVHPPLHGHQNLGGRYKIR